MNNMINLLNKYYYTVPDGNQNVSVCVMAENEWDAASYIEQLYPNCPFQLEELPQDNPQITIQSDRDLAEAMMHRIQGIGEDFEYCVGNPNILTHVYYEPQDNQIFVEMYSTDVINQYLDELNGDYNKFNYSEIPMKSEYILSNAFSNPKILYTFLNSDVLTDFAFREDLTEVLKKIETPYLAKKVMEKVNSEEYHDFVFTAGENVLDMFSQDLWMTKIVDFLEVYLQNSENREGMQNAFEILSNGSMQEILREIDDAAKELYQNRQAHQMMEEMQMDPMQQYDDLDR